MQTQACGLQSSPLHRTGKGRGCIWRWGQAGQTEQSAQVVAILCVPGRAKEMPHVFCFLADPYKFLKVIHFN